MRRFVLFGHWDQDQLLDDRRERRRWWLSVVPLDLLELLPPGTLEAGADAGWLQLLLEQHGVPRRVAQHWPQRIGFRIVQLLLERGRVAFGVFYNRRGVFRATRCWVEPGEERAVRVEPAELLEALYAAGARRRNANRAVLKTREDAAFSRQTRSESAPHS